MDEIIEQVESLIARANIGVIVTMNGTDHHLINQLTRIKEALIKQKWQQHGVMQAEALAFHECIDKWLELDNYQDFADWLYKRVQGASVADGAVGKTVSDGCKHESFTSRNKNGFICDECGKKMKDCAQH